MGMAKLNVWITDLGKTCEMAKRDWVIAIFTCDGKVLEWCGRKYDSIPAKCGHAEIEVPPGCYTLRATAHSWWANGILYGNWATDRTVVQACCDQHYCVTLYAPSAQACWIPLFEVVLPMLARNNALPKNVLDAAKVIQDGMARLSLSDFEKNEAEQLKRIAAAELDQSGAKTK
jgi:hypothetical protein